MEKKPTPKTNKTKPIKIMLHEELVKRINAYCAEQGITIQEFIADAVIERLNLVYK
jgi:predicted DNA binding CopG/RHH family protein